MKQKKKIELVVTFDFRATPKKTEFRRWLAFHFQMVKSLPKWESYKLYKENN
jgi:ribosomal protein S24E